MVKWAEIARECSKPRMETLCERLKKQGLDNEVEFIESDVQNFSETLEKALNEFDGLRIGPPFSEMVLSHFKHRSASMSVLKSADCLIKEGDRWWLRSAARRGFEKVLTNSHIQIDLESSALIVGAGGAARAAIATLIKTGLKEIKITNKFVEQAIELVQDLKRFYFDVNFEFIPQDRLVLMPGTSGVLVNTTPLVVTNDVLEELYYFNFLKTDGLVMDLTVVPPVTPLVSEAKAIGIHVIEGYKISSWVDVSWAQMAWGIELDQATYEEELFERVSKEEFDLTPFHKAESINLSEK